MKTTLLAILFLAMTGQLFGQSDKFFYSLDYSPNFTSTTNKTAAFQSSEAGTFRLAHNAFLKAGYRLANNLFVTGGVGYLSAKEFDTFKAYGLGEIDGVESLRTHAYVVAPVGVLYQIGSFYVSPEIGIGWNTVNRNYDRFYYTSGIVIDNESSDEDNIYQVNPTTYPIFLTLGNEIKMKNCSVILGVKGYYSLNQIGERPTNAVHYYGIGIVGGVKF